jgi:acyl-coenzyme A thioesterase PaaI-like protein
VPNWPLKRAAILFVSRSARGELAIERDVTLCSPAGDETLRSAVTQDLQHFVRALGARVWVESGLTVGHLDVTADLRVPGTMIPRIGVLVTLADLVSGQPPTGPINPTVDLRVRTRPIVGARSVRAVCRVLKHGRTLMVAEGNLFADHETSPFGTITATFMARPLSFEAGENDLDARGSRPESLEDRIGVQRLQAGVLQIAKRSELQNGPNGTIHGGALAVLAELATEDLLHEQGPYIVQDIDVRYLNQVKIGPVRAVATEALATEGEHELHVHLTDIGVGRLVAFVSATMRPFSWSR